MNPLLKGLAWIITFNHSIVHLASILAQVLFHGLGDRYKQKKISIPALIELIEGH